MCVFIAGVSLLDTTRYERDMANIYNLGLRVFTEYGAEVARQTDPALVLAVASWFGRMDHEQVIVAGGDRMVSRRPVLLP
jgi:hypothetical protein